MTTPQHKRPEFILAHKSTDFKEKTDYRNSYQKLHYHKFKKNLGRRPAAVFSHVVVQRKTDIFKNSDVKKPQKEYFYQTHSAVQKDDCRSRQA